MNQQRPPAAPDVQQSLSWMQPQLTTDEIQLRGLRIVERLVTAREVSARVHHLPVEPERIELVADVVVKAHRRAVAVHRMLAPEAREASHATLGRRTVGFVTRRECADVARQ